MFADRGCLLPQPGGHGGGRVQRSTLPGVLRALVEAGFLSRQAGTSRVPDTYRLHLPARCGHDAAAARRCSAPAAPCRWTATPRPASPPTRAPGAPGTASRANTSGPITRAFLDVLEALLWGFHNARSGCCFPSYEAIAAKAECARSTVAEALKALEWAGVLTWQNRITRIRVRERDLFGRWASRWRVIRTSNAYVFRDPQPRLAGVSASKSENPTGTLNQEFLILTAAPPVDPDSPLERALARFGAAIEARLLMNGSGGPVPAT